MTMVDKGTRKAFAPAIPGFKREEPVEKVVDPVVERFRQALSSAVINNDTDRIKELSKGADKQVLTDMLFLACFSSTCDETTVAVLVDSGADLKAMDGMGRTVVHEAASGGNVAALIAVAKAGADVNATDHKRNTPLMEAVRFGQHGAVETLLTLGADLDAKNMFGGSASSLAEKSKNRLVITALKRD